MPQARRALGTLLILGLTLTGTSGDAAKMKVWHQYLQSHFEKAQFKHAIVTSEGALRLSRQVKSLANLHATNVWDMVEDKLGNLFVATGDEGKLFKVTPDGKASVVYTSSDSQILCLTRGPDNAIYAGTGPGGKLVRITADGARVLPCELDSYVWKLVYDADSATLFAATGPKGRVYQVTSDGKAQVYYQTKQEHVLCLAAGPKGTLFAGTDKGGLVYRIDAKGKGFVLYHAHQSEVRSLLVTPEALYAGTSSPTRRPATGGKTTTTFNSEDTGPSTTGRNVQVAALNFDEGMLAQGAAAAPSAPPVGENSVYRIAHDGTVREIFRDKVLILSLLKSNGKLLVSTGMHGQLFEIDESTKEKSEVARLDNSQINCLLKRHDGSIALGTGDPGKVYALEERYALKGTVTSDVLDAKILSKWGALDVEGRHSARNFGQRGCTERQRLRAGRHLERLVHGTGQCSRGPSQRSDRPVFAVPCVPRHRKAAGNAGVSPVCAAVQNNEPGTRGHQFGGARFGCWKRGQSAQAQDQVGGHRSQRGRAYLSPLLP